MELDHQQMLPDLTKVWKIVQNVEMHGLCGQL